MLMKCKSIKTNNLKLLTQHVFHYLHIVIQLMQVAMGGGETSAALDQPYVPSQQKSNPPKEEYQMIVLSVMSRLNVVKVHAVVRVDTPLL